LKTDEQRPIFIIGCPRSGTSLLSSILNRHSKVCVTPELHYFGKNELLTNGINNTDQAINLYNSLANKKLIGICKDDILQELRNNHHQEFEKDTFIAICNAYKKRKRKTIWIEKTPDNVRFIGKILSLFPNALFIYIIRDGRDVALSLEKVDWDWPYHGYISNLAYWSDTTKKLSKNRHIKSTNTHHIKYEDLLDDPKYHITKVCQFINIGFERAMLTPDGSESDLIEPGTTIKDNIKKEVIKTNKYKWEAALSPAQKRLTVKLASKELKDHKYRITDNNENNKKLIKAEEETIKFGFLSNAKLIDDLWDLGYEIIPTTSGSLDKIYPKINDAIWVINSINIDKDKTTNNILILTNTIYKIFFSKLFGIKIIFISKKNKEHQQSKWFTSDLLKKIINSCAIRPQDPNEKSHEQLAILLLDTISKGKKDH